MTTHTDIPSRDSSSDDAASFDETVAAWLSMADARLAAGDAVSQSDLDALRDRLSRSPVRQSLMYLHLTSPNPGSGAIACAIFQAGSDRREQITAGEVQLAYNSVLEAIADGWRVLQFPDQRADYDDSELDMLGYEFILQKMERINADA